MYEPYGPLGARLRAARIDRGLSAAEAARQMNINAKSLLDAEDGKHRIRVRLLGKAIAFYGLNTEEINRLLPRIDATALERPLPPVQQGPTGRLKTGPELRAALAVLTRALTEPQFLDRERRTMALAADILGWALGDANEFANYLTLHLERQAVDDHQETGED